MSLRILMTVIVLAMAAPAAFAGSHQTRGPGEKLTDGIANTATGWTEIPREMVDESGRTNAAVGITKGTVVGTGEAVKKTLTGIADTATFFVSD